MSMKLTPSSSTDLFSTNILESVPTDLTEPQKHVTIAFCIRSKSDHIQGLREILEAMNDNIMNTLEKYRNQRGKLINRIFASSETLRYMLWLLNEAFIPPPEVSLSFKIGDEEVVLPKDPLFGLGHSEFCIKVLFDVLDVGQILTLYKSLMLEQSVAVLARQKQLLFCICEALKMLMFPLEWHLTYIPLLSEQFLESAEGFLGTYFVGLNVYLAVEDYSSALDGATMLDIATSRLHVPQPFQFCPAVEAKLRAHLQELKNPQYSKFDSVNLKGASQSPTNLDFSYLDSEQGPDNYIRKIKQAFLGIWEGAFKNFRACIFVNNQDENEFNRDKFLDEFEGCPGPHCTCKEFWSKVINTTAFDEFVRQSRWLNESQATRIKKLVKPDEVEEPQEYVYVMEPKLSLEEMYDEISELLESLDCKDQQRMHAIKINAIQSITNIKKQLKLHAQNIGNEGDHGLSDTSSHTVSVLSTAHTEGSLAPPQLKIAQSDFRPDFKQSSLRPISPVDFAPELNIFYGKYGLLSLLRAIEVLDPEDIKSISSSNLSIEQLTSEHMVWQEHLIKALILELSEGAPGDIVDEYVKAFEIEPHSLPQYKFALHIKELIVIKPERVRELVRSSGDVMKIAKAAWDDRQSDIFESIKVKENSIDRTNDSLMFRTSKSPTMQRVSADPSGKFAS
mmetsp:Transcript_9644/g.18808  ORF Transcript_9644/g.18808 Transcript_9644/m.18808 type:complete len:676 (-) Transcript_9644:1584-3611(-)